MGRINYYRYLVANALKKFVIGKIGDKELDKRIDTYMFPQRLSPQDKKKRDMKKYKYKFVSHPDVVFTKNGIPFKDGKKLISYKPPKDFTKILESKRKEQKDMDAAWQVANDFLSMQERYYAVLEDEFEEDLE